MIRGARALVDTIGRARPRALGGVGVGRLRLLALMSPVLGVVIWAGDVEAMLVASLAVPTALAALGMRGDAGGRDPLTGLALRRGLVDTLDRALGVTRAGRATAAMVVEIDRFKLIEERHERGAVEQILQIVGERLAAALRQDDVAARLEGPAFAVALASHHLDLEAVIQLAGRVQRSLAEPIALGGFVVNVTASIGFALPTRLPRPSGEALLQAATLAMLEAQRSGPGAIRSYSEAMRARVLTRNGLAEEVAQALDRGEVRAAFQPQVATRTGAVTGFEALARWQHPTRGLIPPVEFLPALEQAGLMGRLGEAMVADALAALKGWDAAGLRVPRVGVNFSSAELADPRLVDRIGWSLDRHDLAPGRLVIEVLETVVATRAEEVVVRNLAGLARLGCCLDLDDFGTGHASITNIRRFSIERIKIDRSFVTRIDQDVEQQKMVGAILTMAERLGLDTLAEGVETPEEQATIAQLGCAHVQGFAVGRPMPLAETEGWIRSWEARLAAGGGAAPRRLRAV